MLHLTESEVIRLLPMQEAIECMRGVFEALGRGKALNQPRRRLVLPTGAVLHSLAGAYRNYFGTKYYSTHPRHGAHFFFALFDANTAEPLASMEANHLGRIRTGAASGYATSLLANPDADTLGVIGSGFQARAQIEAISIVRPIRTVRVWSRGASKRERFAEQCAREFALDVQASPTARDAVSGAQIVVTATSAKEPVLEDSWIAPGTLVNAMGSNIANRRELPSALVARAGLIAVDSLEQARLEAGDLIIPDHWANCIELHNAIRSFDPARITIFKSLGLGVEDVGAGAHVFEKTTLERTSAGRNPATR